MWDYLLFALLASVFSFCVAYAVLTMAARLFCRFIGWHAYEFNRAVPEAAASIHRCRRCGVEWVEYH